MVAQTRRLVQRSSKSEQLLRRYRDFSIFSRWWLSAILDLLGTELDYPRSLLGSLYCCVKFGWNRCSRFDTVKVLVISHVWLEKAYSGPHNWGFWGFLPPKWGAVTKQPPKGICGCEITSFGAKIVKIGAVVAEIS